MIIYNSIPIFAPDGSLITSTAINEGAKRYIALGGEDYITLPLTLAQPTAFPIGSYVEIDPYGRFLIGSELRPTFNPDTAAYDFELKFEAPYRLWRNKITFFSPTSTAREAAFSLTATPDVHLNIILDNLLRYGITYRYGYTARPYIFDIDTSVVEVTEAKLIQYNATNILDVLAQMATLWECDWWITENIIHLGRCEHSSPFAITPAVNAEDVSTSDSRTEYANRLYIFGSDRNIPTNYRPRNDSSLIVNGIVQHRLMLPEGTPFIDARPDLSPDEIVEAVITIDSVYPRTLTSISDVNSYEKQVEDTDPTTGEAIFVKRRFYRFALDGLTFSKDYLLSGVDLSCTFRSGSLNGMSFSLIFNPDGVKDESSVKAQWFEIVASEDYGIFLPDAPLIPAIGDEVVLIGWDATKAADLGLIAKAEAELLEKGKVKAEILARDPATYSCTMMSDFIESQGTYSQSTGLFIFPYTIGHQVEITTPGGVRPSRIIGIEHPLDFPFDSPVLTCGESAAYSRTADLQSQIDDITLRGQTFESAGTGSGIYVISTTDSTIPTDRNVYSALRARREFLNKTGDDSTPYNLTSTALLTGEGGVQASPRFQSGATPDLGHGVKAFTDPASGSTIVEADILRAREAMEAPEFRFNRIDIISGEQWQTFAFGTVRDVITSSPLSGSLTLDILDGEIPTFRPNDIIRGLFHGLALDGSPSTANAPTDTPTDTCNFPTYSGFFTSYLTPTALIDTLGRDTTDPAAAVGFRYTLRPGSPHPRAGMKLAAYGSFTDPSRQSTVWANRTRLTMMEGVDTWSVNPDRHYTYVRGDIEGITIGSRTFHGHGVILGNAYIYGSLDSFSREIRDALQGQSAYSLNLSRNVAVVRILPDGTPEPLTQPHWLAVPTTDTTLAGLTQGGNGSPSNPIYADTDARALTATLPILSTSLQVLHGSQTLLFSDTDAPTQGTYTVTLNPTNCSAIIRGGIIYITDLHPAFSTGRVASVDIRVNCEGEAILDTTFAIDAILDPTPADWRTFVFAPADDYDTQGRPIPPPKPVTSSPYPWLNPESITDNEWIDAPNPNAEIPVWFMSVATIDGSTNLVNTDGWSDPVQCTGEDGIPGNRWDFMYAVTEEQDGDFPPRINTSARNPNNGLDRVIWHDTPRQFPTGGAAWMTVAEIIPDGSTDPFSDGVNNPKTGSLADQWSTPVRISGERGTPGKDGQNAIRLDLDNEYDTILINADGQFALPDKYYPTANIYLYDGGKPVDMDYVRIVSFNDQTDIHPSSGELGDSSVTYLLPGITIVIELDDPETGNPVGKIRVTHADGNIPDRVELRIAAAAYGDPSKIGYAEWTLVRDEGNCIYRLMPKSSQIVVGYDANEPFYRAGTEEVEGEPFIRCDIQRVDRTGEEILTALPDGISLYHVAITQGEKEWSDEWQDSGFGFGYYLPYDPDEDSPLTSVRFELYRNTDEGDKLLDRETVPVVRDGKDGAKGDRGLPGCMIRRWKQITSGQTFRADDKVIEAGDAESGYVDFLMFRAPKAGDNDSGWLVYRCVTDNADGWTYAGGDTELAIPNTETDFETYAAVVMGLARSSDGNTLTDTDGKDIFRKVSTNEASAFFDFLIANHADIDILSGSQFLLRDDDNNVVGGMQGAENDRPIFWAGADTAAMNTAPVRVYADGKAHISGELVSGDADGQRVHIDPTNKSIGIYDVDGTLRTSLTGNNIASIADTVQGQVINPANGDGSNTIQSAGEYGILNMADSWVGFSTDGLVNISYSLGSSNTLTDFVTLTVGSQGDFAIVGSASITMEVWEYSATDYNDPGQRIYSRRVWQASYDTRSDIAESRHPIDLQDQRISFQCTAGKYYQLVAILDGNAGFIKARISVAASFVAENNSYTAIFGANGMALRKGDRSFSVLTEPTYDESGNPDGDSILVHRRNGIPQPYTILAAVIDYSSSEMDILCGNASSVNFATPGSMSFYLDRRYIDSKLIINATPKSPNNSFAVVNRFENYVQPKLTDQNGQFTSGILYLEIKTI